MSALAPTVGADPMPPPPIFIVGTPRSGTTLLASLLASHSRLDCGPESRFFARYRHLERAARLRLVEPATWPTPAVDFVASLSNQGHPVVELFGLSLADVHRYLAVRSPSEAAMLESLTVLHAQRAGKLRWMEKTPRHLLMTDTLRRLWPAAPIVRIVRDPRDVALSLSNMPFAKTSVVGNLVRADHDHRASAGRLAGDPLAMTLRYEDLVAEPERELRRICDFIGEAWEPGMLEREREVASVAGEHEWWKADVAGPLTTSRVGRWQTEMAADVRRFAALHLADFLREHGYEGAQDPRSVAALVPGADATGPAGEQLLVELARRDTVVARPAPATPAELHAQPALAFLGVRGQLDPCRGRGTARRVISVAALAAGALLRRLQGRPILWIRHATLRERRAGDAVEIAVMLVLRLLARQATPQDAWEELAGGGRGA